MGHQQSPHSHPVKHRGELIIKLNDNVGMRNMVESLALSAFECNRPHLSGRIIRQAWHADLSQRLHNLRITVIGNVKPDLDPKALDELRSRFSQYDVHDTTV